MKNIIFIVGITILIFSSGFFDRKPTFLIPATATGERKGSGIKIYEFTELLDKNTPISKLARENYFTVVEGYIDTCSICKRLEADFQPLLKKRKDVLFRKVHFPESGGGKQFRGNSQEEVNRQIAEYYQRLGKYNFNHVVVTDKEYQLTTCGTPHIEIYGPDKKLIATDKCGEKNLKEGLSYLRNWIKAENSRG